jgi:hypothetical protein
MAVFTRGDAEPRTVGDPTENDGRTGSGGPDDENEEATA